MGRRRRRRSRRKSRRRIGVEMGVRNRERCDEEKEKRGREERTPCTTSPTRDLN